MFRFETGFLAAIDPTTPLRYPKPMKVSAQYAASHFDNLLSAVSNGEEVESAAQDTPTLESSDTVPTVLSKPTGRRHHFGAGVGRVVLPTDEEWEAMDKEIEREMTEGPLIPGETLEETMKWLIPAMEKAKREGFPNALRRRKNVPSGRTGDTIPISTDM